MSKYANLKKQAAKAANGNRIPNGNYNCQLVSATMSCNDKGQDVFEFKWIIKTSGPLKGKVITLSYNWDKQTPDAKNPSIMRTYQRDMFLQLADQLKIDFGLVESAKNPAKGWEKAFDELTGRNIVRLITVEDDKRDPKYARYKVRGEKSTLVETVFPDSDEDEEESAPAEEQETPVQEEEEETQPPVPPAKTAKPVAKAPAKAAAPTTEEDPFA